MVVAGGVAMVSGALVGAVLYASFDFWVRASCPGVKELVNDIMLLAPGLIGISLARNPNGLAYQAVEGVRRRTRTLGATACVRSRSRRPSRGATSRPSASIVPSPPKTSMRSIPDSTQPS